MKVSIYFALAFVIFGSSATASEIICSPDANRTALVVIDIQDSFVTRNGYQNNPGNSDKVRQLHGVLVETINTAKKYQVPIVIVEYTGKGETNDVIKKAVKDYKDVKFFGKTTDGMFDGDNKNRQPLIAHLKKVNVGTLAMVGANGGSCVRQSIDKALDGNCNVVVFNKAIADFGYESFVYPFEKNYRDVKAKCQNCKFQEAASKEYFESILAQGNNPPGSLAPRTSVKQ